MASYGDKNALERVFNSYGQHSKCLLERVRDYLDTAPVERSCAPSCSRRIAQAIQRATKEMIANAELTGIKILLDLLLYLSEFPSNGRGLDQLINYNTLPVLLSDMNRFLIGCHKDCNQVIADLIVTVMSLCEYSDKLANSLHLLIPSLLTIAVNNSQYSFTVRIDCVRLLNALLEACDNQYKVTIKSTLIKYNSKLAMLLPSAGDYELQVAIVECLYRTTTAAERRPLAQQWFSSHDVAMSFLAIREADFEQDCRKFLNVLNKYMERCNKATVFSLPCQQVVLGDVKLYAPQDLKQLWMDFNTVSHSLSVFVSSPTQQEDIWESVTVKRTNIADYKITAVPEGHLLLLTVNIPLSSLISFPCTARGNNLQVFFTMNPSHVLDRLLHSNSKTSTAMTPVQLGSGKKLSSRVGLSGPQQMSSNIQTPDRVEDVDVSPIDPLGTPVVNSSTGSVCTPPDQSIPVETPRTSTPSLKTVVANHVDKRMNYSDTLTAANKAGLDQKKRKTLTLSTKKTDQQGQNSKKTDQEDQNSKKSNTQGQNSKKTDQQGQKNKKTSQQDQSSKKTNRQDQNGKKISTKLCDQASTRDDFDHKYITTNKKSIPPLKVTENNIDSFLNQLNTKPKPVTKKYTTRSSVKQSKTSDNKTQNKGQENVTHRQQLSSSIANKTTTMKKQSYQSASPVVKLQQNKRNRVTELPIASAIGLSAFDFDDEEDQPVTKKPRQVDTSVNSSCNSSLEMSRLNASLLARGNTSKSFSMTPQKKGRNSKSKKQSPTKRAVQRKNNNSNSSKANSLEVCIVLESQDVDPTSPPLDGQTTTGTSSVVITTPDDTISPISSCYSPKSDSTYEPSTNFMPSHETPAAVTPSNRKSPDSTAPAVVIEQVTPPQVTPVTTQQSSPAMESANISLEYSQPSTPEADHVITKGFQEVCQELISGTASGRGYNKKPNNPQISIIKEDKMEHDGHFQDEQKENMHKANEAKHQISKPQSVRQHKRTGLKLSNINSSMQATSAQASREQRNKRRRQSTGEMEATPIISPPAKKQSTIRQLDLRITKTPTGKKDVDFNDDANDNLDHVIPDPTPSGSPPMHMQDDISELLGNFGSKINQAMKNKRNHYDQVLQGATKASSQLLNSIWSEQYKRRHELLQNYHKKTMEELHLLEEDIKATKQAEEQAMDIFKHHQKTVTDNLTSQKQKLDDLRATQEHFHNDMESLESSHTKQQGNIHQQLKKEMKNIQDEILNNNKQQELRMVKQSLQAMLLKL